MTYPDGRTVDFVRDALGRAVGVTTTRGDTPTPVLSAVELRADGLPTARRFGNGLSETRGYNAEGRLSRQTLGDQGVDYTYDAAGNLLSRTADTLTQSYGYDAVDRLTEAALARDQDNRTWSYTYDPNGNRLSETEGETEKTYTYEPASNRLSESGGQTLTRDAAGNTLTDDRGNLFSYDATGRLAEVRRGGAVVGTYAYNGLGQRVRKTTADGTTHYLYGPEGQLLAEADATGTLRRAYIWLGLEPLAQIEADGHILYLHTDHLATPRQATDEQGRVVWRWEGEAFGRDAPQEDVDRDGVFARVDLRFPGQYFDAESGLSYNYFRDYDAGTGRYLESDPIGLEGGLNTYAYAGGGPVNRIDLDGRFFFVPLFGWSVTTALADLTVAGSMTWWWQNLQGFDSYEMGKGERGYTGNAGGTKNPDKHWKDDPKNPGWGWQTDPQTGKKTYKKRPPYLPKCP